MLMTSPSLPARLLLALGFLALPTAGCATAPLVTPAAHSAGITARGDIRLAAASTTFSLQSLRLPYELKRLTRIAVYVTDSSASTSEQSLGDLPWDHATLDTADDDSDHTFNAISLKSLKPNHAYSVRLEAYMVDPAQGPDPLRVDLNDNHESETTFDTSAAVAGVTGGAEDQLDIDKLAGGFTLTLRNQAFSGTADGGLAVTNGFLVHTGIEQLAPAKR